jgi:hypothetical protein
MPLTKKPNTVATPPADYASAHRVVDGDNWWTLRDRYGLKDVWDIIAYNFNTYDPKEVNWYLANKVGCVLTTADGKNYRFSSAASPGVIYIPKATWKADGKLGKMPSGGDGPAPGENAGGSADPDAPLTDDDLRSKASAVSTVRAAATLMLEFVVPFSNYLVTKGKFQKVHTYLEEEYIRTRHRPALGKYAKYFIDGNEMHLGFREMGTAEQSGLIVHEAVHAMMDIDAQPIIDKHSEAAAYIAQMYYMIVIDPDYRNLPPGMTEEDLRLGRASGGRYIPNQRPRNCTQEIFTHAWYLAMSLFFRRPKQCPSEPPEGRYSLNMTRYMQLLAAVEGDKDYRDHAREASGYNGVEQKKPRPA